MRRSIGAALLAATLLSSSPSSGRATGNPLQDPSLEMTRDKDRRSPSVKPIATFEDGNPFSGGVVVEAGAPEGRKALRIDRSYASLDRPQDWVGYDFLKAELDSAAAVPMDLAIEVRDTATRDYWTRVNYTTVVPPGRSTLIIPVKQLYVGEKARPGRMLDLAHITRLKSSSSTRNPRARCCWITSGWSATTRPRGSAFPVSTPSTSAPARAR